MKTQNMFRMQAVILGVAAGLFLASAAPAQEITNTEWPDRPGATEAVPSTPLQTADTANPAVPTNQPAMTQESATRERLVGSETIAFVLIGIVGVVLYTQSGKKRAGRNVPAGRTDLERNASLS